MIQGLLPDTAFGPVEDREHVVQEEIVPRAVVQGRADGVRPIEVGDGVHVPLPRSRTAPLASNPREQPGSGAPRHDCRHRGEGEPQQGDPQKLGHEGFSLDIMRGEWNTRRSARPGTAIIRAVMNGVL